MDINDMIDRPDKTTRADQNALAIMVAIIYAARLGAYIGRPDDWAHWHVRRKDFIAASVTEAIMICEAVADDFPVSSG